MSVNDFLNRKLLTRIIYVILFLILLYFISIFFSAFTVHGTIDADVYKITSGVDGYIQKVYVKDNQLVKKGELLLTLDPTPYALNVDAANAVLAESELQSQLAEDDYQRVKIMVTAAEQKVLQSKTSMLRYQQLLQTKNVSPDDFEKIQLTFQLAQDDLNKGNLQLLTAQHTLDLQKKIELEKAAALHLAEYQLSLTKIVAPTTGYISNLRFYNNDYVRLGQMLFGVIDIQSWRVLGYFYENEIRSMKPGQKVLIALMSNPWRFYSGSVESIPRGVAREASSQDVSLSYSQPVMGWFANNYYFPVRISFNHPAELPLYVGANAFVWVIF